MKTAQSRESSLEYTVKHFAKGLPALPSTEDGDIVATPVPQCRMEDALPHNCSLFPPAFWLLKRPVGMLTK